MVPAALMRFYRTYSFCVPPSSQDPACTAEVGGFDGTLTEAGLHEVKASPPRALSDTTDRTF